MQGGNKKPDVSEQTHHQDQRGSNDELLLQPSDFQNTSACEGAGDKGQAPGTYPHGPRPRQQCYSLVCPITDDIRQNKAKIDQSLTVCLIMRIICYLRSKIATLLFSPCLFHRFHPNIILKIFTAVVLTFFRPHVSLTSDNIFTDQNVQDKSGFLFLLLLHFPLTFESKVCLHPL